MSCPRCHRPASVSYISGQSALTGELFWNTVYWCRRCKEMLSFTEDPNPFPPIVSADALEIQKPSE